MENIVKINLKDLLVNFALDVVEVYKKLVFDQREFVISKRILKCGTGVGANYSAGREVRAYKKAVETEFWLEVLRQGKYCVGKRIEEDLKALTVKNRIVIDELEKVI